MSSCQVMRVQNVEAFLRLSIFMSINQFVSFVKSQSLLSAHLAVCSSLDAVVHHDDWPVSHWAVVLFELATILALKQTIQCKPSLTAWGWSSPPRWPPWEPVWPLTLTMPLSPSLGSLWLDPLWTRALSQLISDHTSARCGDWSHHGGWGQCSISSMKIVYSGMVNIA